MDENTISVNANIGSKLCCDGNDTPKFKKILANKVRSFWTNKNVLVLDKGYLKQNKSHTIRHEAKVLELIPLSQIKQEMPVSKFDINTLTRSKPSDELRMKKDDSVWYLKNPNSFSSNLHDLAANVINQKSQRSKSTSKFIKIKCKVRNSHKQKKVRKIKSNKKSKSKSPLKKSNIKHFDD